jgi:hypothetical protein
LGTSLPFRTRDERRDVSQHRASEALTQDRKSSTLRVRQSQSVPNQLCFQRPILLAKEGNYIALLAHRRPRAA